ncbi:peptidase C69 [Clostridiales bacterium PH28_bin88]|nr:peptidase C69 [Clostridiales bacterium PH28_bin88]
MTEINYRELAEAAVARAQAMGAGMSEAYCVAAKELSIEISKQEIETMKMAEDYGIGMRVIAGGRMGFAFTSDLSAEAREEMVRRALANAEKASEDRYNTLPAPPRGYTRLDLYDPSIAQTRLDDKIQLAMEIERQARTYDRRVKITESCTYQDAEYLITLVNSLGIADSYRGAYCGAFAYVVAEEGGDNQTGFGLQYSQHYRDLDPVKVGREAGEKAVRMLGAKTIGTQKAAVVFDPYIATSFLGVLAPALSAEAVQKGKSLFAGKAGRRVASSLITIVDDGTRPQGILSAPFDGEGVPTGKTVLVQEGELRGYLHNTYTAAKDGVKSTGNGIRGTFKSTPEVGATNFYIAPGQVSKQELLKDISRGLYITEVMGMHTANPISGDFSVGAAGILIENGELTTPVRGVAIAGNMVDLLEAIDCVADDLTFIVGKGSPTLRVSRMTISGS